MLVPVDSTEGGFNHKQIRRAHQHAKGNRTPAPLTQHKHKKRKVKGRERWLGFLVRRPERAMFVPGPDAPRPQCLLQAILPVAIDNPQVTVCAPRDAGIGECVLLLLTRYRRNVLSY